MKRSASLLAWGFLGVSLFVMPTETYSANHVYKSAESSTTIVDVVYDSSSGISGANLTATLDDGTVLGFHQYLASRTISQTGDVYFEGAISMRQELIIPDSIRYPSGEKYAVVTINNCDLSQASNVTSLTLPAKISSLYGLPSSIKVLHAKSYIKGANVDVSIISNLSKVFVPEKNLNSYYEDLTWRQNVIITEEGTEPLKLTINMTKAGEFAQRFLEQTDNWYKVNELTVVGELNSDDLNVFKRMKQLVRLDLSQAVISDIPNSFAGAGGYNRDGFPLLEELLLPELNTIGGNAFYYSNKLKNVLIQSVKTIGEYAFAYCGFSEINLPEDIETIGYGAFQYSGLQSITIPSSITKINGDCFYGCSELSSVVIPSSVTEIGSSAFASTPLTSINLPGVQIIEGYAFNSCNKLADVKFAKGLSILEQNAFYGCTALTEIDLPATLCGMMTGNPFSGCKNIKKVICRAVTPAPHKADFSYGEYSFGDLDKTNVKLYVPAMSIDSYRKQNGWKDFYTILPLEDKTSYIHVYDDATIKDVSEFTEGCELVLDWYSHYYEGSYRNYYGTLDYSGNTMFSMGNFKQCHDLGGNHYGGYSSSSYHSSLVANGSMRADNVQTVLYVNNTDIWNFISFPYDVKVSDIAYPEGCRFAIRKYSGFNRARQTGNTWLNLTEDSVMHAYEGYILKCNMDKAEFTFPAINNGNKNKVFEAGNVVMPLGEYIGEFEHNRSWNLIGNPYPCYYDTRKMDFTAPITVWNGRSYDAYSPVDDEYILRPTEAFFVQCPVDCNSFTFNSSGRQKDSEVQPLQARMKNNGESGSSVRRVYNITMSDGVVEDRTRFVMNENASRSYELDKDASKFVDGDNTQMLVYTIENGVKYAINERPLANGIVGLGFFAPTDGEYTLTLDMQHDENIILVDNETKTQTELSEGYRFSASAGYCDTRFTIVVGGTTGISNISQENLRISIENGLVSADMPYSVYTIDGRLVGDFAAGVTAVLAKGMYVVSSKDVKRKIVVK